MILRAAAAELEAIERRWEALCARASGHGGNPYHDAEGKFTSAGGQGHSHGRDRRRRRLRRKLHELRATHQAERRKLAEERRGHWERHRERYGRKESAMVRRHRAEARRIEAQHEREIAVKERRRERERARESEQKAKGRVTDEQVSRWEAEHEADVRTDREFNARIREQYALNREAERSDLREERRAEAERLRKHHAARRRKVIERQRREREELIAAHGFRRKGAGRGLVDRPDHGLGVGDGMVVWLSRRQDAGSLPVGMRDRRQSPGPRRLAPGRTHKAGSAESILRHCLRRRGWSAAWRRGELTERERIGLLDEVREYGRAWLRHEAEQLFRHHGGGIDGMAVGAGADALGAGGRAVAGLSGLEPGESAPVTRALAPALRRHVGRFFDRVKGFVRELIVAGAMALNGPAPLSEGDLDDADRRAHEQAMYLDRFRGEVESNGPPELAVPTGPPPPGAMSAAQFAARVESYAGSTWGGSINARRQHILASRRYAQERRVHAKPLGQHDACATCEGESARGWVPIGTLLPIGDSDCLGIHCDCYFEYRTLDGERSIGLLERKGQGNPYHDAEGHFTDPGHVGHAAPKVRKTRRKKAVRKRRPIAHGYKGKARPKGAPKDEARVRAALASHKRTGKQEKDYAKANEHRLAGNIGGTSFADNDPSDVDIEVDGKAHHLELKSMLTGEKGQTNMARQSVGRKVAKSKETGRPFHMVVLDDRDVYNQGASKHLHSGHRMYFKTGVARYNIKDMHPVKDENEIRELLATPYDRWPEKAKAGKTAVAGMDAKWIR